MTLLAKLFPRRYVAHSLATHLVGPWAIEPRPLRLAVDEARARLAATPAAEIRALATLPPGERLALRVRLEPTSAEAMPGAAAISPPAATYCACIPISGLIIRGDASCARIMGLDATGLGEIEHAIRAAAADPSVTELCLEVSSPGGVANGVQEIVDLIRAVKATKPVRAEINGLCASAAYWLVSQCTEIVAEGSASIGSIGAFCVVEDSSKAAEAEGCVVHVVRSGPYKGVGVEGAPVTAEQLADLRRNVDGVTTLFIESIATGRGMTSEAVRALATGQEWLGAEAVKLGLIDRLAQPELVVSTGTAPSSTPMTPTAAQAGGHLAREGGITASARAAATVQEDIVNEKEVAALADRLAKLEAKDQEKTTELAALKSRNLELEAESKVRAAALAETIKARKTAAIEAGVTAGRIVGDMRAQVEAYASAVGDDVEKLERFVAALPVQTRPSALGQTPGQAGPGALSADDRRIAAAFGVTEAQMEAASRVEFISLDGQTGVTADRRRVKLVE